MNITPSQPRRQRGAAVIALVLMLAFIATMASAFALRGQLADIRGAAHAQRAAQALAAAEAGTDWAVLMLGQGRIDEACQPSADIARATFRQRHLHQDAAGALHATPQRAACVMAAGAWRCACADATLAALGDRSTPGFSLGFVDDASSPGRPAVTRLQVRGCAQADAACLQGRERGDGRADVSLLLAQLSALPSIPAAAVTTAGDFDPGTGGALLDGADAEGTGLAIAAGGGVTDRAEAQMTGRPGSPHDAWMASHVDALATTSMFTQLFGLDRASHRAQPALVRVACGDGDCSTALQATAAAHPGRTLWVAGDLRVQSPLVLGTPQAPVLLSVDGDLLAGADVRLHGLLHLAGTHLSSTGGRVQVQGAVVAERALTLDGAVAVTYHMAALRWLQQRQGSLVPVPGGWRDAAYAP